MSTKHYGIARESGEFGKWYNIILLFGSCALKLTLYTPRGKRPKYYFYTDTEFLTFKCFFGLLIKK